MLRLGRYCMIAMLLCIGAGSRALGQLKIDYPNGGERFNPGDTVDVRWSGGAANDTVRVQYSSNEGRTWRTISRHATGGRVPWVVPNVPGHSYLMRATTERFD